MKLSELVVGQQYRMANGRDCIVVEIGDSKMVGIAGQSGKIVLVRTGDRKEKWVGPSALKEPIDYTSQ